jgi:hypothetical protein
MEVGRESALTERDYSRSLVPAVASNVAFALRKLSCGTGKLQEDSIGRDKGGNQDTNEEELVR